ncbi:MAG: hypothetical protein K0T53_02745 [Wolbachia pipientis]|nr:hypothetical protein [Wolbachia pipientis]
MYCTSRENWGGANRKTYVYSAKVDNDQIENTSVMANVWLLF